MLRTFVGCLLFSITVTVVTYAQEPKNVTEPTTESSAESDTTEDPDFPQLMGKWIVTSVEHDGKWTPAQIGQKPGDIISIVPRNDRAFFS